MEKRQTCDLAGLWRFAMDKEDRGFAKHWEKTRLPQTITLPGCLQAQGYGDAINTDTPWVQSLYDALWYQRGEYAYAQENGTKVPFLSQPPRHYTGKAWYQKTIFVSEKADGFVGRLTLESTKWKTMLWIDGECKGSITSLCAPHVYETGALSAGEHIVTICIDNGWQLPYRPDGHGVSDALGATWNGIAGAITLELFNRVWIERIQVNAQVPQATIQVHLKNETSHIQSCIVRVQDTVRTDICAEMLCALTPGNQICELTLNYPSDTPLWDEFDQNLQHLIVTLSDASDASQGKSATITLPTQSPLQLEEVVSQSPKAVLQTEEVTFGFRRAEVKDGHFVINGRNTYLRGTHFGGDYPLSGIPDCDSAYWDKIMNTVKTWGMNFIRCHSYCPPEAAFAAADRAGVYLQIECDMWNVFAPDAAMNDVLWDETKRILDTFGNHPSFLMLSPSNEPGGDWLAPLTDWVAKCRAYDSRHLYTVQSGWPYPMEPDKITGTDYVYFHRSGFGIQPGGTIRGPRGWHGGDYRESLKGISYPVICHELGQWCSYPDYDVIDKFTGYLQPGNFEIFRESARAHGVLGQNKDFVYHSGCQQVRMLKEDLEANQRTPHIYGFELLDLHDYLGQGSALVGILDPFWDSKGYITPSEWRQFCDETVLLARIESYCIDRARKATVSIPIEVSHFGREPLQSVCIHWQLEQQPGTQYTYGEHGKTLTQTGFPSPVLLGTLEPKDYALEKNQSAGCIYLNIEEIEPNCAYTLRVSMKANGKLVQNTWPLWLFDGSKSSEASISDKPDKASILLEKSNKSSPSDKLNATTDAHEVYITSDRFRAESFLDEGKRVLFELPYEDTSYDCPPVRFNPSFWNSQMGPTWARGMGMIILNEHPAFASFPTTADGGWQWQSLIENARGLRVEKLNCDCITNLVQPIDEWNRNDKMSLLFECRVGNGHLMMTSMNLEQDTAQAAALKRSILSYMKSDAFAPHGQASWEQIASLFEMNTVMKKLDAEIAPDASAQTHFNYPDERNISQHSNSSEATNDSLSACLDGNPQTFMRLTGGYPYSFIIRTPQKHTLCGILYMPRQNHREHEGELRSYRIEAWINDAWKLIAQDHLSSSYEPKRIAFPQEIYTDRIRFTALDTFTASGKNYFWVMERDGWYRKEADPIANPDFKGQLPQDIFSASVINLLLAEKEENRVWKEMIEQRELAHSEDSKKNGKQAAEDLQAVTSEKSATAEIDN